uniref:Protein kinase domain-containing protein n=1 Tax=Panagrellus redivivus TaxID=6233 RepID=A0A7E4ZQ96_PANRE
MQITKSRRRFNPVGVRRYRIHSTDRPVAGRRLESCPDAVCDMATTDKGDRDRLPQTNDVLKGESGKQYKLQQVLGEGGYGTVFRVCEDGSNRNLALKAEKWSKTVLKIEIGVLRATTSKNCKHFCQFVDSGKQPHEFMFIVMSLLGPDLAKLRNEQIDRRFTLPTAVRIAMQTASAIEELHRIGFISRDVKPGNFAIGNKDEDLHRLVFMFDFGLARKYVDKNNNVLPPRKEPGWRGTTRYGSLQAHQKLDLGRRDDLESWFYAIVELTKGALPWRLVVDRSRVQDAKIRARAEGRADFLQNCPKQYDQILNVLDKLSFEAAPPYEQISKILLDCCAENNIMMNQRYDWEGDPTSSMHTSVTTQSLDKSPSDQVRAANVPGEGRPTRPEL